MVNLKKSNKKLKMLGLNLEELHRRWSFYFWCLFDDELATFYCFIFTILAEIAYLVGFTNVSFVIPLILTGYILNLLWISIFKMYFDGLTIINKMPKFYLGTYIVLFLIGCWFDFIPMLITTLIPINLLLLVYRFYDFEFEDINYSLCFILSICSFVSFIALVVILIGMEMISTKVIIATVLIYITGFSGIIFFKHLLFLFLRIGPFTIFAKLFIGLTFIPMVLKIIILIVLFFSIPVITYMEDESCDIITFYKDINY